MKYFVIFLILVSFSVIAFAEPIPEPKSEPNTPNENCGPGTTLQSGMCVVEKSQNVTVISSGIWGEPEIIITTCNTIERDEYSWSADNCDAKKLSEMQFNFMMQIYPQILECEENGNTWNREKLECVKENEN